MYNLIVLNGPHNASQGLHVEVILGSNLDDTFNDLEVRLIGNSWKISFTNLNLHFIVLIVSAPKNCFIWTYNKNLKQGIILSLVEWVTEYRD